MAVSFQRTVDEIARRFIDAYYEVAFHTPQDLSNMFRPDATLVHDKLAARGVNEIRAVGPKLIIASQKAMILSMTSHASDAERIHVLVTGAFSEGRIFLQTFMIVRPDLPSEYMCCETDIFNSISVAEVAAIFPDVQLGQPTKSISEGLENSCSASTFPEVTELSPGAEHEIVHHDPPQTQAQDYRNRHSKYHSQHSRPQLQRGVSVVIKLSSFGLNWLSDFRTLKLAIFEEFSRYGSPVKSVTIKTWSRVVSVTYDSPEAMRNAVNMWSRGPLNDGMFAGIHLDVFEEHYKNANRLALARGVRKNPEDDQLVPESTPSSNAGISAVPPQVERTTKDSHEYGPTATVRLAGFGRRRLKNFAALKLAIYEEFSMYGHPVRNVSIKPYINIVYINYDNDEAVRAAVNAWGPGTRDKGRFAGLQLLVSEKRAKHHT